MPDDNAALDADFLQIGADAEAQRLNAHQVDFRRLVGGRMPEPPARVIFAKAGRLHQRVRFKRTRIRGNRGQGLGEIGHQG